MSAHGKPLQGANIVVTRPEGRGESLCRRIAAAGGNALFFPAIAIQPLRPAVIPDLPPDWVIFSSPSAVEHGVAVLNRLQPGRSRIAAIGSGTASSLHEAGWQADEIPDRHESEGLLDLAAFQNLRGQHIWIVRGRGGREVLADGLRDRGAQVHFVEVYVRMLPKQDASVLLAAWRNERVDAVVISSRAGLENLYDMLDDEGRRRLQDTQLVVPTARMLKLTFELDVRPAPIVAEGASDDAFMVALANWWRERRQDSQ